MPSRGDAGGGQSAGELLVLQGTGSHADVADAFQGGAHTGGGIGLVDFDGSVGVHCFIGFLSASPSWGVTGGGAVDTHGAAGVGAARQPVFPEEGSPHLPRPSASSL